MFGFGKNKKQQDQTNIATEEPKQEQPRKASWASRLGFGLKRTRNNFSKGLANLVLGKKIIDDDLFEELETILLTADVGVDASQKILKSITDQVSRKQLSDPSRLIDALREQLHNNLEPYAKALDTANTKPFILLMVGVNGAGKTTSIAKIDHHFKQHGKKVMLAAGDTFRAAAVEQLQVWGERNQVPVVAQKSGADSASVIFDAIQSAHAKNIDIIIADTAGRLHTQDHLMDELEKIKRVIQKLNPDAPHETMLVIDAGTGQNALHQAEQFNKAIGLTGITLTKLDGTAKGGIIFAVTEKMKLPIRFIGVGEQIDDLRPFEAAEFVEALFE